MTKLSLISAILLLGAASAHAKDPYEAVAREVTAAALGVGAQRAQFLPLVGADGRITAQGRMLSARLLERLLAQRKLAVVLGSLPGTVLEPYLGLFDEADAREFHRRVRPAKAAPAEVTILGSYLLVRGRIKANIQAVEAASGRVIFAREQEFNDDWPTLTDLWAPPVERRVALLPQEDAEPAAAAQPADPMEALRDSVGSKAVPVGFSLDAPEAKSVELVGAFLARTQGRAPMSKDAKGRWSATVYLAPGQTYRYHFLVDGVERRLDPSNPNAARGLSLLSVH